MTDIHNPGIATIGGGSIRFDGPVAVGAGATIHAAPATQPHPPGTPAGPGVDAGIITILSEEARAIRHVLGLEPDEGGGFDLGTLTISGQRHTLAATRALAQGQESAVSAFYRLRDHHRPRLVVLAGIAGAMHHSLRLGDVVVATRVVCYDLRKETPAGIAHRGQERQAPAEITQAVNRFFTDNGEPARLKGEDRGRAFRVFTGPIGSGNAVIADRGSATLRYLARFNNQILAVEMEAAGLSGACYEQMTGSRPQPWVAIRGISDDASARKNDRHHRIAAQHAAVAVRELLPYLLSPRHRA